MPGWLDTIFFLGPYLLEVGSNDLVTKDKKREARWNELKGSLTPFWMLPASSCW